ncbi:MAG: TraR/DksA family transcriptional regulator [Planctomycetota bacterium]
MKKRVQMKAEVKPVAPAQKVARKTAAVSSAAKPTISTSREILPAEGNLHAGRNSKATAPSVAPTILSKAGDGRVRSTTKPAGLNNVPTRATRKPAPPDIVEPSPTSQDPIQYPEETTRKIKTYLNAKQLREFKTILLRKRGELAGDVERLTSEALKGNGQGRGDQSTMPIHMADLGSDTWEQDFTIGLIANEQNIVREIDDALERIADKTYGMCLATDQEISLARLHAKPWAKYCIEYERAREEGRAP